MNKCYLCGNDLIEASGKVELVWREHLGIFVESSYEECSCVEKLFCNEEVERLQNLAIETHNKTL